MTALPRITDQTPLSPAVLIHMNERAGSEEIAQATRQITAEEWQSVGVTILTPAHAHADAVKAARDRFAADFRALKPARRSRIRPRHVFAVMFTAAVILIGWHMSDAFARAQADTRIIQSMEKVK